MTSVKLELAGVSAANGPPELLVNMQEVEETMNFDVSQIATSINKDPTKLEAIAKKINPLDRGSISKYGARIQQKLADSADDMLQAVLDQNLVEVGEIISEMVETIKQFDATTNGKLTFLLSFSRQSSLQRLKFLQEKCKKTMLTLDTLKKRLESKQLRLDTEMKLLDDLYLQNLEYYKKLSLYIIVGQRSLAQIRDRQLEEFLPDDAPVEAALARNDLIEWCNSFSERLQSLEVSRTICLQAAPQIRLVQRAIEQIVQRIQECVYNMLSLWEHQMATTLAMESARTIIEVQNDLVDTVKHDNANFIASLNGFLSAQQTGCKYQNTASTELSRLTGILNQYR